MPIAYWDSLGDPFSITRFFLLSVVCLSACWLYSPRRGHLTLVSAAYLLALALSCLLSMNAVSVIGKPLSYFTALLPMCLVACVYHFSIGEDYESVINAFLAGCFLASVGCFLQAYGILLAQGDYFNGRSYFGMGNPVFLSGILAMAIPLCLGHTHRPFLIPVFFTAILLTQSRSGLIAAAVGMLGYSLYRGVIGRKLFTLLACAAVVVCAGLFAGLRNTDQSDRGRYHMTRVALMALKDNPSGLGPERFGWAMQRYRDEALDKDMGPDWSNGYAHNSILEALLTGGLPFLAVHICLLIAIWLFILRFGNGNVAGCAISLFVFGLMQPTPLALKACLAAFLGVLEPSPQTMPRTLPRAPFAIAIALALFFSFEGVFVSRLEMDAEDAGFTDYLLKHRK
jgi:hypothetical protein